MEDALLDKILTELSKRSTTDAFDINDFLKEIGLHSEADSEHMLDYLVRLNYIVKDRRSEWQMPSGAGKQGWDLYIQQIKITPLGIKFIKSGGFSYETSYKKDTLQVAKDSKKYAKWAFGISVIGVVLALILFLLDKF